MCGIQNIKRKFFIVVAAFMIGISNVILEEERMLNDLTHQIEHVEKQRTNQDNNRDLVLSRKRHNRVLNYQKKKKRKS